MKTMGTIGRRWRQLKPHTPALLGLALAAGLLLYMLGSLPVSGFISSAEAETAKHSASLRSLIDNPLYLPLTALQYLFVAFLPLHDIISLRLASVVVAGLGIASLLYVIRRWYGQRVLLFAALIIVTAAGFLHSGRLATFDVLYLVAIPLLIASHIALAHTPERKRVVIGWFFVAAALCYIPGMIWFVLLQAIWQRQAIKEGFAALGAWWRQLTLVGVLSVGLAPLLYGFISNLNHDYLLTWFGLPTEVPVVMDLAKNAAAALLFIFARAPTDPARWLGHLPLLSAFLLICFVAGIVFYLMHIKAERTKLLLSLSGITLLLLTAGGVVSRSLLIPLVYLVAFGGLAYILHYWLKLFPINPFARRLGISLVAIAVALTCVYNVRHYYIAWPHNKAVEAAFDQPFNRP